MPPVYCPHCRRPLILTKEMQGRPVRCPSCAKFFQAGPGGVVAVAAPAPPPPVAQPAPPPVINVELAPPEQADELERFDVGETVEGKMQELRLETVAKGAGDNLILAGAANVLAAFLLGVGALLTGSGPAVTSLLFLVLVLWLLGVTAMIFGAVQLKNLRLRPVVVAAAYAALGVGGFGTFASLASGVLLAVFLTKSDSPSAAGGDASLVQPGVNVGPVVFLLVFGVLLAVAAFTLYAGNRTLQTLKDPEIDAALRRPTA